MVNDYWPAIGSVIALVVWFVRLEGRVNQVEKDHALLRANHDSLDSKVVEQLADVRESLARIEGKLGIAKAP